MITITRAEHDRLREGAEDVANVQAYNQAIAVGGKSIPSEFIKRMIEGESPTRTYREFRRPTQAVLATGSGVNRVQIAEIEADRKSGSVATLRKLATALGVTMDDLV